MTPQQFIAKWQGCQLAERAFYQQHFNDLCALAGHPTPAAQDTVGDTFCFEKGATKTGGGNGWADVWKRGFFAVEYKGPNGDLRKALDQVQRYALALENPPLLVVARADLIEIHTNFTNTVSDTHIIALEEIGTPDMGNDPRYNSTLTFETFPFPEGLSPKDTALQTPSSSPLSGGEQCSSTEGVPRINSSPDKGRLGGVKVLDEAIATATQALSTLRNNWLNPPEWVGVRTPEEEKVGYPARPVAKPGYEAELKKRTITYLQYGPNTHQGT